MDDLFEFIDDDGSGSVDFEELRVGCVLEVTGKGV